MGNMGNRTFVLSGAYYYVWGGGKEKNDPELSKWIPPRPWLVHLPHCDTTLVLARERGGNQVLTSFLHTRILARLYAMRRD